MYPRSMFTVKIRNFSFENYYFYSHENSLCIAWACFRNEVSYSVTAENFTAHFVTGMSCI